MRVIQIHAGIHKTGSTALQHTLARLVPDLAAHGVALPNFGSRGHWHHALAGFAPDPERADRAWGKLVRRIRKSPAERVLLSSEHFVSADPEAVKAALDQLGPHEPRIHFYVRPHIGLYTSLYLQRVKAGAAVAAPTRFAESYSQGPEFDYVPAIERYIDVFGPEAVRVREFDPARFEGGSLIADAWHFLDLPSAVLAKATEGGDTIVNPTPTAEQAVLLIALARRLRGAMGRGADPQPLRRALWSLLTELREHMPEGGTAYRLPLALQRAIAAHTEPARAAFAHRLDRPASEVFLSEPLQAPEPIGLIPFDAARAGLTAAANSLRDAGAPDLAAVAERFATGLTSMPGPDGATILQLPTPRAPAAGALA
jgi:hypothetical protein